MKPKFFGQYLLEKGYITAQQLHEALEYHRQRCKRFGDIAVTEGFMIHQQVNNVIIEQRRIDKLFGELAVSMGFLTDEQLETVITIQRNNHIYLGEALVEKVAFTVDELDKYLECFHEEHKPLSNLEKMVPEEFGRREEVVALLDLSIKMFRRMANMYLKIGSGYYKENRVDNLFLMSSVQISGSFKMQYLMNIPAPLAEVITKNLYDNKDMECDKETMSDCIGELSNVICGNSLAQLLNLGHNLQILPPRPMFRSEVPTLNIEKNEELLSIPASVPLHDGTIDFEILFKKSGDS